MTKRSLPIFLICIVGMLLYGNTLHVPLYLDDYSNIANNPAVKDLGLAFRGIFNRRGLCILSFALNYRFGGEDVAGYHLVNISIHVASAIVVLLLLRRVFSQRPWLPLFGALLFLVHPLQTQSVTYLVQRMTSLSAFFFFLSLYLFVRGRELLERDKAFGDRRHLVCYTGALIAGGLAILSKENAVVLPLALLLFVRLLLPAPKRHWRPLLIYTLPFFVLPGVAVLAYLILPVMTGSELNTVRTSGLLNNIQGNSPLHYLVTQFNVLWIYIRMLFLPYGQALDHNYPVSRELLTLNSLLGLSGLLGLLVLALRLSSRQPVIAGAILWFFLTLAVESSIIPLDPLFEHRLYLPLFGFALLIPALVALLPQPRMEVGIAAAILFPLALLTWQRNALWNDPVAFYQNELRVAPHNERAMYNLGEEYRANGDEAAAEKMYLQSLEANPRANFGYLALGNLYDQQGRNAEVIEMLRYAVKKIPDDSLLYNALAVAYGKEGDLDTAISLLQRAVELNPAVAVSYFNLARMYALSGAQHQVEINLRKTLSLDKDHAEAQSMLDDMRARQGH